MHTIKIPTLQTFFDQIQDLIDDHGLIVIGSSNQNKTSWAGYEVMNVLLNKFGRTSDIVTMGDLDQYTDRGQYRVASLDEIRAGMIVYGGAIRSLEKANLLLEAAKTCPVVAITHCFSPVVRFKDMGCDMKQVHEVVKAVFVFEDAPDFRGL